MTLISTKWHPTARGILSVLWRRRDDPFSEKIETVIHNAKCFQKIRAEFGSFSEYIWGFAQEKTCLYMGHQKGNVPARNGLSDQISADLKKRGLKYMGSVTVCSHLQACGIINNHWEECF